MCLYLGTRKCNSAHSHSGSPSVSLVSGVTDASCTKKPVKAGSTEPSLWVLLSHSKGNGFTGAALYHSFSRSPSLSFPPLSFSPLSFPLSLSPVSFMSPYSLIEFKLCMVCLLEESENSNRVRMTFLFMPVCAVYPYLCLYTLLYIHQFIL